MRRVSKSSDCASIMEPVQSNVSHKNNDMNSGDCFPSQEIYVLHEVNT